MTSPFNCFDESKGLLGQPDLVRNPRKGKSSDTEQQIDRGPLYFKCMQSDSEKTGKAGETVIPVTFFNKLPVAVLSIASNYNEFHDFKISNYAVQV